MSRHELSPAQLNYSRYGAQAAERKWKMVAKPTASEEAFRQILFQLRISHRFQQCVFTANRYFICDFVIDTPTCDGERLIIEVDGPSHDGSADYDAMRTKLIASTRSLGRYRVVRITNAQVANGQAIEVLRSLYPRQFARWYGPDALRKTPLDPRAGMTAKERAAKRLFKAQKRNQGR